jgi:nucleoid-associated protein YgaU
MVTVAAWLVLLVVALSVVHALPVPRIGLPPLATPAALPQWATDLRPADAVLGFLRVVTLASGWYLVVGTVIGLLARLTRARPLVRCADVVTLPALRRFLDAAVGATVAVVAIAGPAGAATSAPRLVAAAVVRSLDDTSTTLPAYEDDEGANPAPDPAPAERGPAPEPERATAPDQQQPTPGPGPGAPPPPTVTTAPPPTSPPPSAPPWSVPPPSAPPPALPPAPPAAPRPPIRLERPAPAPVATPAPPPATVHDSAGSWTVESGDNFWRKAERVLTDAWQGPPTVGEVAGYWRTLIDANRSRLRRNTPDLIYPGQVFVVPPAPTRP